MKEQIIKYLIDNYDPETIITYGSYADGSANKHSDFDAMIIAKSDLTHDSSEVCGVTLDVFIYPPEQFSGEYDTAEFIMLQDSSIELDKNGAGKRLMESVLRYLEALPAKTHDEIKQNLEWCEKMFLRTGRGDAEGYYRWHWVLIDSLEFYSDIIGELYRGPKKSIRKMAANDGESFALYEAALKDFSRESLRAWLDRLKELAAGRN